MNPDLIQKLISIRRTIHKNPELGYLEFNTSKIILNELDALGIPYEMIASTGVVATLTKGKGPTIILRADMDALPIQEQSNLDYASTSAGLMHACGHDLHTTILIGAMHELSNSNFDGTIKFIFQPSEEGNKYDPIALAHEPKKSGGERVAESGVLDGALAAIGLHVHPLLLTGKLGYCVGDALAATAFFNIEVKGVGGHAAFPQLTIDPICIASKFIVESQAIISRNIDPTESKVLSFTNIQTGKLDEDVNTKNLSPVENIIPEIVTIQGTVRALNPKVFEAIKIKLQALADSYKISDGATITIEYTLNYPNLKNDKTIHQTLNPVLETVFGKEHIIPITPILGGEDFAFYSQKIPSFFYFLGSNDGTNRFFLHHPMVVFDEACMNYGVELLTNSALQLLK